MLFETTPEDVGFLKGQCPTCERTTLLYRQLDAQDNFTHHCLDCDQLISSPDQDQWNVGTLTERGYKLEGQNANKRKGSCGNCGH